MEPIRDRQTTHPAIEDIRRHIGAVVDTYYQTPYLNRLLMRLVRESDPEEAHRIADSYLTPLSRAYDRLKALGL